MGFINTQAGKKIEETTVLLEVGVPTSITGKTYLLDGALRAAVNGLQGKKVYVAYGNATGGDNVSDGSRTCGVIENIKLVESRQNRGYGVIVGDVRPSGPFGAHLRDAITGAEQVNTFYGMHALCARPDKEDVNKLSVKQIVGWNLITAK